MMRVREKAVMDYASDIKTARDEGMVAGIAEERKKNAIIAKYFGISEDDVCELLKQQNMLQKCNGIDKTSLLSDIF